MAGTRKVGQVRRWDATRGFGFIRGPGDGADVFFHVRDWRGGAQPQEGMTVNFEEIHVGGKGPRAMAVQLHNRATAATAAPAPRPRTYAARHKTRQAARSGRPLWWWTALLIWIGALGAGAHLQRLPLWTLGVIFVVNVVTFFAYMFDKSAAERSARRTPENTLHTYALLGGWPAARLAQQMFRHKSNKEGFQAGYAATVFLNVAGVLAWLYWGPRLLMA